MGNKRICVLLLCLAFAGICAAVQADPNDLPLEMKFERGTEPQNWIVGGEKDEKGETIYYRRNPGPIKPKYVAEVIFSRKVGYGDEVQVLKRVEKSLLAEKLSQAQKDFLKTGHGIWVDYERRRIPDCYSIWFYAVSEDDAKKMAHAFIEFLTNRANAKMQSLLTRRQELQAKIAETKKKIPEKATEIKAVDSEIAKRKKENITVSYLSAAEANKTISELNRMFSTLSIELAGIRARLETIEIYKDKLGKEISADHYLKLEQMLIEQTIELRAAEAKRKTTLELLSRIQAFCDAHQRLAQLQVTKRSLSRDLPTYEKEQREIKETLANPTLDMLPPKVYQNKVTIYPVRTGE